MPQSFLRRRFLVSVVAWTTRLLIIWNLSLLGKLLFKLNLSWKKGAVKFKKNRSNLCFRPKCWHLHEFCKCRKMATHVPVERMVFRLDYVGQGYADDFWTCSKVPRASRLARNPTLTKRYRVSDFPSMISAIGFWLHICISISSITKDLHKGCSLMNWRQLGSGHSQPP